MTLKTKLLRFALVTSIAALVCCRGEGPPRTNHVELYEGFSAGIAARNHVMAALRKNGTWPASNVEANLLPSASYATSRLADLTVSAGGVVTVRFKSGARLRLSPDQRRLPVGARWRCTTTRFENPAAIVPCRPESVNQQ
jgi:hypothetical protein